MIVTPAKAGVSTWRPDAPFEIPASAGMTIDGAVCRLACDCKNV